MSENRVGQLRVARSATAGSTALVRASLGRTEPTRAARCSIGRLGGTRVGLCVQLRGAGDGWLDGPSCRRRAYGAVGAAQTSTVANVSCRPRWGDDLIDLGPIFAEAVAGAARAGGLRLGADVHRRRLDLRRGATGARRAVEMMNGRATTAARCSAASQKARFVGPAAGCRRIAYGRSHTADTAANAATAERRAKPGARGNEHDTRRQL